MINGLQNALIGMGGDCATIVEDESRLLAMEIAKDVGPKDRSKTKARIDKSVRQRFQELSADVGFDTNSGREGSTGVRWYRCDKNFLFGVTPDSDMRHADPETLANIYYRSKKVQGKTRIILPFKHPRQHQQVAITSKILVSKSGLNGAVRIVQNAIGKLKASWFATAKKIEPSLVSPQWIERHIKNNRTSKSITELGGLQRHESPSITFGSKAVGVAKFDRAIQFAVGVRAKKVAARMKLVLSGYSSDVAHGIAVKRHAKKGRQP